MKTINLNNAQHELLSTLLQRQYRNQKDVGTYYELQAFHAAEIGDGLEAARNEELHTTNDELLISIRHLIYKLGIEVES